MEVCLVNDSGTPDPLSGQTARGKTGWHLRAY